LGWKEKEREKGSTTPEGEQDSCPPGVLGWTEKEEMGDTKVVT
jgi:hypothetical protein